MEISLIVLLKSIALGLFGLVIHTMKKFSALKNQSSKIKNPSEKPLDFKRYIHDDLANHIINLCSVLVWFLLLNEAFIIIDKHMPDYSSLVFLILSVTIGYFNSSIVLSVLSKTKERLDTVMDKKASVADSVFSAKEEKQN